MYSSLVLLVTLTGLLFNGSLSAPIEEKSLEPDNLCSTTLTFVKDGLSTSEIKEKLVSSISKQSKASICRGGKGKCGAKGKGYGKPQYYGNNNNNYYSNYYYDNSDYKEPSYGNYYDDYYSGNNDYYSDDYYNDYSYSNSYSYDEGYSGDDYYGGYNDDYYDDYYKNGCKGKSCKQGRTGRPAGGNGPAATAAPGSSNHAKLLRSEPAVADEPVAEDLELNSLVDEFLSVIGINESSPTQRSSGISPLDILQKCSTSVPANQPLKTFISAVKQLVATFFA